MTEWVFSIKPEYVEAILRGEKRWEFRRRCTGPNEGDRVFMYATKPVGEVVGSFVIGRAWTVCVRADSYNFTEAEWREVHTMAGTGYVTALEVTWLQEYASPRPLSDFGLTHAPQRYARVKERNDEHSDDAPGESAGA